MNEVETKIVKRFIDMAELTGYDRGRIYYITEDVRRGHEYEALKALAEDKPEADGWIKHDGQVGPVPLDTLIERDIAKEYILFSIDSLYTYEKYVKTKLAGDFACEIARAIKDRDKLISEQSAKLRGMKSRISELERVVIDGRMYADKIADDWEKLAFWLEEKSYSDEEGCVPPSRLIVIREMLVRIFKETEQVLPTPPKKED